jgi:hypothetical protein
MSDFGISDKEMSFLTGGQSMKVRSVPLKIRGTVFAESGELMHAIRTYFTEEDCQEVLRQLQASGMLSGEEVAQAQQRAAAFPATATEPAVQRAAVIAVGMVAKKGALSPLKVASLARIANALDRAGHFELADKIDNLLSELQG